MSERIINLILSNGESQSFAVVELLSDIQRLAHAGGFDFATFWYNFSLFPQPRRIGDELTQLDELIADYLSLHPATIPFFELPTSEFLVSAVLGLVAGLNLDPLTRNFFHALCFYRDVTFSNRRVVQ